jgi:deazaflavin-dependent oxidoreductase (nitroreductase family)
VPGRGAARHTAAVIRYTTLLRRLADRRWVAVLGRWLTPLDRRLHRVSRGRVTVTGGRGVPSLLLTTTGRRSGQARVQPLLYVRDGSGYVVIGSNWGQAAHPAWSANLLAQPDAVITIDGVKVPVRAALATGGERDRLWTLMARHWPAYRTYKERAEGRELRVFKLTPR